MPPLPLPSPATSGLQTGPYNPNYVDPFDKETIKETITHSIPQGSTQNPGVVLSTYGEDVPLEYAHGIKREATLAARPSLSPLFRTRYVDKQEMESAFRSDYEELRAHLPPELKAQLEADEKRPFRNRDSNLIALDQSLLFEAMRRAIVRHLGNKVADREAAKAHPFMELSENVRGNLLLFCKQVLKYLNQDLERRGANDPSYDLLLNIANHIKEGIALFIQQGKIRDSAVFQQKLNRFGHRLKQLIETLQEHPLTQNTWILAQQALDLLRLQTHWSSAETLAPYLMSLQAAFLGSSTQKSAVGFVGPTLNKMQDAISIVMANILPKREAAVGWSELFATGTLLITILVSYTATQLLGDWKGLFPPYDKVEAERAGRLLQELGLIWLFNSHSVEALFEVLTHGMGLDEKQQKIVNQAGSFYALIVTVLLLEKENVSQEELLESMQRFLKSPLPALEQVLEKASGRMGIDESLMAVGLSQLQTIRQVLESNDPANVSVVFHHSLEALGLAYPSLKNDLNGVSKLCSQLSEAFNHLFYQTEKAITTMDQAA